MLTTFKLGVNPGLDPPVEKADYKKYLRGMFVQIQNTPGAGYDPTIISKVGSVPCSNILANASAPHINEEIFN